MKHSRCRVQSQARPSPPFLVDGRIRIARSRSHTAAILAKAQ
ncbi:hypothetical protein BURPSS13_C0020 [Burkholderia pseudomallei S13]|nr:hypothetical protein BURPSS13_C0020 [Burkholderia pseudomallei S13]EEC31449.1 hypothetical protein BUC_5007 [Burkholderia pseudomallei 576]